MACIGATSYHMTVTQPLPPVRNQTASVLPLSRIPL